MSALLTTATVYITLTIAPRMAWTDGELSYENVSTPMQVVEIIIGNRTVRIIEPL